MINPNDLSGNCGVVGNPFTAWGKGHKGADLHKWFADNGLKTASIVGLAAGTVVIVVGGVALAIPAATAAAVTAGTIVLSLERFLPEPILFTPLVLVRKSRPELCGGYCN